MTSSDQRPSIRSRIFAVAAITLGTSMLGSLLDFYYVNCFLNYYHIQESWFQVAQTVHLIWNTVNDPLFAYVQDNTNFPCTRSRRVNILYLSPLLALSFLIPWFPWGYQDSSQSWMVGVHLIITLCVWDTLSTCIGLSKSCLNAELALDYETRIKVIRYNHVASLIGSSSVFLVQYVSNGLEDFRTFQTTCVMIAIVSCLLTRVGAGRAFTERELTQMISKGNDNDNGCFEENKQTGSFFKLSKDLLTNRDMLSLIAVIVLQHIHAQSLNKFLGIFCDQLIPKGTIPEIVRSAFYAGVFMFTKVTTIICLDVVRRYGYYKIAMFGYTLKIIMGTTYLLFELTGPWALIFFYFVDVFTADGMGAFHGLALSDISDSDARKHNRERPITAMIHGTISILAKPMNSLTPMFVVNTLNRYGYEDSKRGRLDPGRQEVLSAVMFQIVCLFPIVSGSLQVLAWSFYTIRRNKSKAPGLINDECVTNGDF